MLSSASFLLLPAALALHVSVLVQARYNPIEMLCAVNKIRAQHGLPALGPNSALDRAAQGHSDYQAAKRKMSHTGAGHSDPSERIEKAGYNWQSVAENVAYGYSNQEQCLDEWMNSPGHKANILNRDVTHLGSAVGYANDGTAYYTQDFGGDGRKHSYSACPAGYGDYQDADQGDYDQNDGQDYGGPDYGGQDADVQNYGDQDYGNQDYGGQDSNDGSYPSSDYAPYGDLGSNQGGDDYGSSLPSSNDYAQYQPTSDYGNYADSYIPSNSQGYGDYSPSSNHRSYGNSDSYAPSRDYGHGGFSPSSDRSDYGSPRGRSRSRHSGRRDRSCDDDKSGHRHSRRSSHSNSAYLVRRSDGVYGMSHWELPEDAPGLVNLARRGPEYEDDGAHGKSSWTGL